MITESTLAAVRGHLEDRSIALEWIRMIGLELKNFRRALPGGYLALINLGGEAMSSFHQIETHLLPELKKTVERM